LQRRSALESGEPNARGHRCAVANRGVLACVGWPVDQVIGHHWADVVGAEFCCDHNDLKLREQGNRAGCASLDKPFLNADLLAQVAELLRYAASRKDQGLGVLRPARGLDHCAADDAVQLGPAGRVDLPAQSHRNGTRRLTAAATNETTSRARRNTVQTRRSQTLAYRFPLRNPPGASRMNASTPPSLSSTRIDPVLTWVGRVLIPGGAITAGCLMLAYVQVCQEAVTRGERWRVEQRALAVPGTLVSQLASRP